MDHVFDVETEADTGARIVYVRAVAETEVPDALRAEIRAHVGPDQPLYAMHNAKGERLAFVKDRAMAFSIARQNDITALSVH